MTELLQDLRLKKSLNWPRFRSDTDRRRFGKVRGSRSLFRFLLLTGLTFFIYSPSFASDIQFDIKADNLKFDQESSILEASGSVEAKFLDITIRSQVMAVNTSKNIATAEGNVVLKRNDYEAKCTRLVYDLKKDEAYVQDFSAVINPSEVKGSVFLSVKNLKDLKHLKAGTNATSTTCDLKSPHYFVSAQKFYYMPDDKMVGAGTTIYFSGIPAMWLPFYVYDLATRRASLVMPIFGSNPVEGDFIKSQVDYYVNEKNTGSILLDLMKKKGIGYGLKHEYKIGGNQSGNLSFYHVDEDDTKISDWVTKINHELRIGKYAKLSFSNAYTKIYVVPSGRLDKTDSKISFDFNRENKRTFNFSLNASDNRAASISENSFSIANGFNAINSNYSYNFRKNLSSPKWQNISQNILHSQKIINDSIDLAVSANYIKNSTQEGFPFDERLDQTETLTHRGSFYTLKLVQSNYIDLDKDSYFADSNIEFIEKIPEVICTVNAIDLKLLKISPEFTAARYRESRYVSKLKSQRDFASNMYKGSFTANKSITMPIGSTIEVSYGLDQYKYEPGDERYLKRENLSLNTEIGGFFKNNAKYEKNTSDGNSPFFFDIRGASTHNLRETMVFYKGNEHRFTIDGGYNYLINKYFDLALNYDSKPSDKLQLIMNSGYDIENKKWKNLVSTIAFLPFLGLKDNFSHTVDLNDGKTKYASNSFDWEIGNTWDQKWKINLNHIYDVSSNKFILQEASAIKDLHCWEAKYSWSEAMKEFRITFTLRAFPEQPIGYASGSRGFFMEGIPKESPVRY